MSEEDTATRVREICMALPDVVEKPFGGHTAPSFRIRDKLFVMTSEDGGSMTFRTQLVEWRLPSASFLFEADYNAGVRTAGLLKRQSPERLAAIRQAIEEGVRRYGKDDGFAVPFAAHIVVVRK